MVSRNYRWVVLFAFILVGGVNQMLWLNFAPLISFIQEKYIVSELVASSLILVFPLIYVFLSIPAGSLTDSKGYKWSIGFGSILMAIFSILRIYEASFTALLIGQIGISIGQPFIMNGISKLVSDWFHKEHAAIATGLGTVGMFIGMALGMALTPYLVHSIGFKSTMTFFACITVASTIFFLVFAKERTESSHKSDLSISEMKKMKELFLNKDLSILFLMSLLGLGFFNGLTTWLEAILKLNGINAQDAGIIGGILIVGGIFGAIIIPALSDHFKRRRPFLLLCIITGIILTYPFCTSSNFNVLLILGFIFGFFFLPSYALLLEMAAELAGPERTGLATGVLMLTGNAGVVVVILAIDLVKVGPSNFFPSIILMIGLLIVALFLGTRVSETFQLPTKS